MNRTGTTDLRRALHVAVSAPGEGYGEVPVEIVTRSGTFRGRCTPNGGAFELLDPPTAEQIVVGVPAERGNHAVQRLRKTCSWPQPLSLRLGVEERTTSVLIEFTARNGDRPSIILYARTRRHHAVAEVHASLSALCPVPSALFEVGSGITGPDGTARFDGLSHGFYRVELQQYPRGLALTGNHKLGVALREGEERELVVEFEEVGSLTGAVVGPDQGRGVHPVEFTRIAANGVRGFGGLDTESDGKFSLDGVPVGRYSVTVWSPGCRRATRIVEVHAAGATECVLELERGGSVVRGQLVDETGKPIAGARLNLNVVPDGPALRVGGQGTRTDEDGRFEWQGVDRGAHRLIHWDAMAMLPLEVATDDTVDLGVLTAGRRLAESDGERASRRRRIRGPLVRKNEVRGHVVRQDGSAVTPGGVWVALRSAEAEGWIRFERTDGEGAFRLWPVEPGEYETWIEPAAHFGGFPPTEPRRVSVGAEGVSVDLVMPE